MLNLKDQKLEQVEFAVVDVETTGMWSNHNRIIDIGVVIIKNLNIHSTWQSLVYTEQPVPFWITEFTSISSGMLLNKPRFEELAEHILSMLDNKVFVGHNVGFDYSFIKQEFLRAGKDVNLRQLCTVRLGKRFYPNLRNYKLDTFIDLFNIDISSRHRALPDAHATAITLQKFINAAKTQYDITTINGLLDFQGKKVKTTGAKDFEKPLF